MSETDDLASQPLQTACDEEQTSPVAEMLVRAREGKNLSQQDVADQLFLTVTYIKYIDEGRFDKIPKPAFTRGYLRSYARIVGVSGDEVVSCYEEANGKGDLASGSLHNVTEEEVGTARFTGPVAQTGVFGLVGAGLLIFLVWWLVPTEEEVSEGGLDVAEPFVATTPERDPQAAGESTSVGPADSDQALLAESGPAAEPILAPARQQAAVDEATAETPPETVIDGTSPVSAQDDEEAAVLVDDSLDVAEPLDAGDDEPIASESAREVSIERYQDGEYRVISVLADGEDHLKFTFVDECWLEVEDVEEFVVYADLNHAGDIVDIYGQAPFRILIGRAQSVTLLFNDQPFSLVPHILNDTAKLVVGN